MISIFRAPRTHFSTYKKPFKDKRLSFLELGILAYLDLTYEEIEYGFAEKDKENVQRNEILEKGLLDVGGEETIKRALDHLVKLRYLRMRKNTRRVK